MPGFASGQSRRSRMTAGVPEGGPVLKPLLWKDERVPGDAVLAASPPPGTDLEKWMAGLPPLTDLEAPLQLAPGWSVGFTAVPGGGPAAVDAEIFPPDGARRAGWAGTARLDVDDVWLARIRITGTVGLWAGNLSLAGVRDPLRIAKDTWAAARRGELAGALASVTWR